MRCNACRLLFQMWICSAVCLGVDRRVAPCLLNVWAFCSACVQHQVHHFQRCPWGFFFFLNCKTLGCNWYVLSVPDLKTTFWQGTFRQHYFQQCGDTEIVFQWSRLTIYSSEAAVHKMSLRTDVINEKLNFFFFISLQSNAWFYKQPPFSQFHI